MPSAAPATVRCLPGARWACLGCAACCERFDLGPLDPRELAALRAADLPTRWPPAAAGAWWEQRPGHDGAPAAFLTRRGGACVFLDEARRCALHRLLGEEAKPGFCRVFPLLLVQDPARVTATVRPVCPGWHASRHTGPPLAEAAAAVLAGTLPGPLARFEPALVEILPGAAVDPSAWEALEPALLRLLVRTEGGPEARVAALRRALQRACGRPETTTDPRALAAARALVLARLRAALTRIAPDHDDPDPRATLVRRCKAWLDAPDSGPAPCAPDGVAYLAVLLESLVFGRAFLGPGGLPRALGSYLLDTWLARRTEPDVTPTAAVIADRIAAWGTVAGHAAVRDVLYRSPLTDLFLHADGP
jgi:Fe-S-cluster containining protein